MWSGEKVSGAYVKKTFGCKVGEGVESVKG